MGSNSGSGWLAVEVECVVSQIETNVEDEFRRMLHGQRLQTKNSTGKRSAPGSGDSVEVRLRSLMHVLAVQTVIRRARAVTGHDSTMRPPRTTNTSLCRATVGQTWRGMP